MLRGPFIGPVFYFLYLLYKNKYILFSFIGIKIHILKKQGQKEQTLISVGQGYSKLAHYICAGWSMP
jgi:hypothetical protein